MEMNNGKRKWKGKLFATHTHPTPTATRKQEAKKSSRQRHRQQLFSSSVPGGMMSEPAAPHGRTAASQHPTTQQSQALVLCLSSVQQKKNAMLRCKQSKKESKNPTIQHDLYFLDFFSRFKTTSSSQVHKSSSHRIIKTPSKRNVVSDTSRETR